jgi:hypothetical protein
VLGASSGAAVAASICDEECWSPNGHGGGDAAENRGEEARASSSHAWPSEESRSIWPDHAPQQREGEEVGEGGGQ